MWRRGDHAAANAQLLELCSGMRTRVLSALTLSPRQARLKVTSEGERLAGIRFLTESSNDELRAEVFELAETMRQVSGEAGRSLAEAARDPELAPILREAEGVRGALNDLVVGAAREGSDAQSISAELTRLARDQLEREASRRLAERGVATRPIETLALSKRLGPTDAAVGFRRLADWSKNEESGELELLGDRLFVHVLSSEGVLTRVNLGDAGELEVLASNWRESLGASLLRGVSLEVDAEVNPELRAGCALRKRLLDPILKVCGEGVQRLFVCADDFVFLIPLDVLPLDDQGGERLGDRVRIVNEVSFARLLAEGSPATSEPSLLSFGGVDYDAAGDAPAGFSGISPPLAKAESTEVKGEGTGEAGASLKRGLHSSIPTEFKKLNQARREVEETAEQFSEAFGIEASLLMRESTTKAALFKAAPGKRYVHIATHGWFAPESVRSTEDATSESESFAHMTVEERINGLAPMTLCGLAMAGANNGRDSLGRVSGILTAEELCSLDLSQCELAVLSACETNVGIRRAGQGIQSLQAALYAAGARTSITSLWKVDDAATRSLMEAFYTNLWHNGMGKSEALWQAKKALRDDGDPPAYWAGWVLTGDPD